MTNRLEPPTVKSPWFYRAFFAVGPGASAEFWMEPGPCATGQEGWPLPSRQLIKDPSAEGHDAGEAGFDLRGYEVIGAGSGNALREGGDEAASCKLLLDEERRQQRHAEP